MPAQAGIHLQRRGKAKENLDSGPGSSPGQALRWNDGKKSRPAVDSSFGEPSAEPFPRPDPGLDPSVLSVKRIRNERPACAGMTTLHAA